MFLLNWAGPFSLALDLVFGLRTEMVSSSSNLAFHLIYSHLSPFFPHCDPPSISYQITIKLKLILQEKAHWIITLKTPHNEGIDEIGLQSGLDALDKGPVEHTITILWCRNSSPMQNYSVIFSPLLTNICSIL